MRIQALLLALLAMHVHVVGQVVTFNYKSAPLETVLLDVARQTGFSFLYQGQNLSEGRINFNNANPVTAIFDDVELSVALQIVFDKQPNYSFSVEKDLKRVLITNKPLVAENPVTFYTQHGRVSDEAGKPVEGVTISLKSGARFTTTDSNGIFQLEGIRENDTLIITHVSYATRYERTKVRRAMEIQIFPTTNNLDEVVVSVVPTGYQKIPEHKMTGSFSHIGSQQFNRRISTNFMDRIENMSTGVLFSRNQGSGSAVGKELVVRGISTIFGETRPLIVIDNFPYEGDLNNINPNDIESVTILKDAVATGLWGALAGNGVVIINTKKGNFEQTPKVSLVSNVTVSGKPDLFYMPILSSKNFLEITEFLYGNGFYNSDIAVPYGIVPPNVMILDSLNNGLLSPGDAQSKLGKLSGNDIRSDLSKYLYRRSVNQQYALNVSGGGNKMRYYFSSGFDKNFTNLARNFYDRITLNASNTYLLLKDQLEFTAGVAFAQSTTADNNNGLILNNYPYTRMVDENGDPAIVQVDWRQGYKDVVTASGNLMNWDYKPVEELSLADNQTKLTDYRVNLGADYKLDFLVKGLKITAKYQFGRGLSKQENYRDVGTYFTRNLVNLYTQVDGPGNITTPIPKGGIIDINNYDYTSHSGRVQADYNRVWKSIHNFSVLAGLERRSLETQTDRVRYYGYDRSSQQRANVDLVTKFPLYPTPFLPERIPNPNLSVGTTDHYLSYYTNLMYNFKYRYNFSFNLRKDESNLFGERINQHGTPLWSVGAGWRMTSEKWFDIGWLSELRLRATHGYTGNIDKSISPYTVIKYATVPSNYNSLQAFIANPANRQLQWEKIRISNFAIDFSIKNYKVSGTLEFFIKDSKDLVGFQPVDQTTGVSTYKGNVASMRGKGFDFTLNARFINTKNWKWHGTLLYSYVSNRVTNYADSGRAIHVYITQLSQNPVNGTPLHSIYAYDWAGLNPENGNPQIFLNKERTEQYDQINTLTDRSNIIYVGPASPKFFGSYRNTISFKNLDVSFLVQYKMGHYFRRPSMNYSTFFRGQDFGHPDYAIRWQNEGDEKFTNVPSLTYPTNPSRDNAYIYSEALVEKADHIRLQDIQIGYTLGKKPGNRLPFQSITLNVYINNIGIIWKATHSKLDPDYLSDTYRAPLTSAIGIQVNF